MPIALVDYRIGVTEIENNVANILQQYWQIF